MTSIQEEFSTLIDATFPEGVTLKQKRLEEWEKMYYAGFHAAMTFFIRNSELPQAEAEQRMERIFAELTARINRDRNEANGRRN